jgi:hypothetical protein
VLGIDVHPAPFADQIPKISLNRCVPIDGKAILEIEGANGKCG